MFNFLKKLFSKTEEEEVEKEVIKVEGLGEWFKGRGDKILSDLNVNIMDIKSRVKEEILKTKDNLAILGTAKLHNPKISVKERQFMEGNRKAYILAVNTFLRGIDLEKEDYSALLGICDNFNNGLLGFSKSTVRPYHILQEFFAHESRNIAINIKNLETLIGELVLAIKNANLAKIDELKNGIVGLDNKIKQKSELRDFLIDKEKARSSFLKNKESIEKEIDVLVKSKEYKSLNELKANREVILASIREHNAKIIHAFSIIEKPLKKLERSVVEDSGLLEKYIDHPVEALVSDSSLRIISLLGKMEKNINNLTLELKDRKREKVLETIQGLTGEFLKEFINKHEELKKKLKTLDKEIRENETLKKENKLNYELSNLKDNLEKLEGEIDLTMRELGKINIEEMKNNLGKEINGLLKTNVVVS